MLYSLKSLERHRGLATMRSPPAPLTSLAGPVAWNGGALALKPEAAHDAQDLARLSSERTAPMLRLAGLPEAEVARLAEMQHRARTQAYGAQFPDARSWIAEVDGAFAGRLLEADEPGGVYVVDIALVAEHRGRGLGRALVAALQAGQAGRGHVRARAALDNAASRALFAGLGFVETAGGADGVDVELVWPAAAPASPPMTAACSRS